MSIEQLLLSSDNLKIFVNDDREIDLSCLKRVRIISGFPGIGKTTLASKYPSVFIDVDSGPYFWKDYDATKKEQGKYTYKVKNENFVSDYLDAVQRILLRTSNTVIMVSQHNEIREGLKIRGIPFATVFPKLSLKEEYLKRYEKRGNNHIFIEDVKKNWENWIEPLSQEKLSTVKIPINSYLSELFIREQIKTRE